jgi:UDP-2,3-diacylglucosamine hydrolase
LSDATTSGRIGHTWFVSDLHLNARRPEAVRACHALLAQACTQAEALYVLGDLFDAWVGDDDLALPLHAEIAASMRRYVDAGGRLYALHGNRDFLLSERFCRESGARLIGDPHLVDLYGVATVLMHGDLLCTEDIRYQALRRQVRDPVWQSAFLARPLAERHALAAALSRENEVEKSQKTDAIMDVAESAVQELLRRFAYPRLIHGHTHRPARHVHEVDGRTCDRFVLSDWYHGAAYLECTSQGCRSVSLPGQW